MRNPIPISFAVVAATFPCANGVAALSDTSLIIFRGATYSQASGPRCSNGKSAIKRDGGYWCRASKDLKITYQSYDYRRYVKSRCPDGARAMRYKVSWWCPVKGNGGTPPDGEYTARLRWTPPSTRANGQPLALSELSGYEIYYVSDNLGQGVTVTVPGGRKTGYVVDELAPGTYHFSISAIDIKGLKSRLSPVVTATFGR